MRSDGYSPKTLSVGVIGLGALGNEVVRSLALLGIGNIFLIDHDIVDSTNLDRSLFYRRCGSVGRLKCDAMADVLRSWFPKTTVTSAPCEIADLGYSELRGIQLIFGCVDNDSARLDIAYVSAHNGIPVCDGGLRAPHYAAGRVSFFPGPPGPCYGCLLPSGRRAELLSAMHSTAHSCSARAGEAEERSSTPTISAIIGAMQVELGLRALESLRSGEAQEAFTVQASLAPELHLTRILHSVSPACPFHEILSMRIEADHNVTALDIIRAHGEGASIMLDAPVCVRASCRDCNHEWVPRVRLGRFRKDGVCPSCRSARIDPLDVIHSIDHSSSWARHRLRDFGFPQRHLYLVAGNREEQ